MATSYIFRDSLQKSVRWQNLSGCFYQTPPFWFSQWLFSVVVLVFVLVSGCCCGLHRLCFHVADAAEAAVDTKCIAAIAVAIAPAVAAVITNAVALTAAITALVASAVAPCCNHCHLAVAVAVAVARVVARSVAVAAAVVAAAMSGHQRRCTCAALVEGRWSNNNALLGLRCLAQLVLLGLLSSAHVKARLLMRWLALRACDAGQRWEGGSGTCCGDNGNNKQQSTKMGSGRNNGGGNGDWQW